MLFWAFNIADENHAMNWSDADMAQGGEGKVYSGPSGSGVVPITTVLMIVGAGAFFGKLFGYEPKTV